MNRNIQFLFVQRNHRIINLMQIFADFQKDIRVKVIDSYREPNNMFLKQLQIIHYSHKINSICNLPFKRIWGYPINDIKCKDDTQYYVIFTNASLFPMSPSYLMKIKKQYKLKYILYCIDTRNTSGFQDAEPYLQQMKFDYILTFDYSDSKRYGYLYYKLPYSKLPIKPCETTKDLYYVGSCKKGLTSLHELYHRERKKAVLELYKNVYIYPKFPYGYTSFVTFRLVSSRVKSVVYKPFYFPSRVIKRRLRSLKWGSKWGSIHSECINMYKKGEA